MGLIYKITNTVNNKVYIGQTTQSLENRWKGHLRVANANVPHFALQKAINKYGSKNFIYEILEDNIDKKNLNAREEYWIKKYNSHGPNGYNCTDGGEDVGRRVVYKLDISTLNIIEKYESATEAAEKNNCDLSALSKVCRLEGNHASLGGFRWCYEELYDQLKDSHIKTALCQRKIYGIDPATEKIIHSYSSVKEATKDGYDQSSISSCLTGKIRTYKGLNWCYADEFYNYKPLFSFKRVAQMDLNNNVLQIWNNAKDAELELQLPSDAKTSIRRVCRNKQKTAYGYKWKYVE